MQRDKKKGMSRKLGRERRRKERGFLVKKRKKLQDGIFIFRRGGNQAYSKRNSSALQNGSTGLQKVC